MITTELIYNFQKENQSCAFSWVSKRNLGKWMTEKLFAVPTPSRPRSGAAAPRTWSWTRRSLGRAGSWGPPRPGGPLHGGRARARRSPAVGPVGSRTELVAPYFSRAPGCTRSRESSRSRRVASGETAGCSRESSRCCRVEARSLSSVVAPVCQFSSFPWVIRGAGGGPPRVRCSS